MHHSLCLASTLLFIATATAQTASYTLFAEGCNGAAVSNCSSLNDVNPVMAVASLPNDYAYPVINTTGTTIQIAGFEIFTTTNTANTETGKTGLIYDPSGPTATMQTRPDPANVANGTITVNPAQGW